MYTNILLSTDGSDVASKGVKHGADLAKALNAKVTVITVTEMLPVGYSGWIPTQEAIDHFDAAAKEQADKILDEARGIGKLLLGSQTSEVLVDGGVPVLVVH